MIERMLNYARRFKIGVFGSAAGEEVDRLKKEAFEVGTEIASRGCILVTGACLGLPYEAALGADAEGGMILGFSPAINLDQHINFYNFPVHPHILSFTGMERKGRNIITTRTCDAAIFISGRSGTLSEFTNLYDESDSSKVIGLLSRSGGVVDNEIATFMRRNSTEKKSRARITRQSDPVRIVNWIVNELELITQEEKNET